MICEKCGKSIAAENANFCPHCGSPVKTSPPAVCKACGKTLPASVARFCPYCGASLQEPEKIIMVCPACAREYDDGFLYCEACGRKLQKKQQDQQQQDQTHGTAQGLFTEKVNGVSYYQGEPKFSAKGMLGTLQVSADKVVFKIAFGGMLHGGFMAMGKEIVLEMPQIQSVREGKYGGVFPMLVLETRDGKTHSFASSVPGSNKAMERAMYAIEQNILHTQG